MGAMWKNAGRAENANKRSAVFTKLAKEIAVAAKNGDPNPENNPRLRAAVEAAKKASMPRDTIERNIKKGAGLTGEQVIYESQLFEGFAPHKVPVIIECLTDNKNRTTSDIRTLFRKGQLGSAGSVAWMFDRMGVVEATHAEAKDIEEAAIEGGAQNVDALDASDLPEGHKAGGCFYCDSADLNTVSKYLSGTGWQVTSAELRYVPKNAVDVSGDQLKEVTEFLNGIDDHDDVHRIFTALK